MLLGTTPFRARTHRELLNQHVSLAPPLERIAYLPADLRSVVTRLLAKDPGERFADADAVVKALDRCGGAPARGAEQPADVGATTREADAVKDPKHVAGSPSRATALMAAGAAILMVGAGWIFLRDSKPAGSPAAVVAPTTAPVVAVATPVADAKPPAPPATAPAVISRKSIAVLPFENLSGRPEDAYLADGLQEEILNALARFRDLKVISRSSVMEYRGKPPNIREVGQRLGVGTVLEGSIRREGNTLRLTVQLIDTSDDNHLLATSYDRELNKVLDLQSTVARVVANALAATLSRQERGELDRVATNNGDAYDRYLHALALFRQSAPNDPDGLLEPKRLLEEALRLDPHYADAYALLSQVFTWSTFSDDKRPENGPAAKQAFEEAFANDPRLPEAQLARGLYSLYVSKNLDQALVDLSAVAQARPNSAEAHNVLGLALRRQGRFEQALFHLERAEILDPLNESYDGRALVTLLGLRRYPEAIKATEALSARFPTAPGPYLVRARIQSRLQKSAEPLKVAAREHAGHLDWVDNTLIQAEIAQLEGRYLEAASLWERAAYEWNPLSRGLQIGSLYFAAGEQALAEQAFREAEAFALELQRREPQRVDLLELSLVQSMLGRHDAALATIDLARAESPESRDAVNGPRFSLIRGLILVRAGRADEGYAEVARLLRVPFGSPFDFVGKENNLSPENHLSLLTKGDPRFDELLNRPPRL